MSQHPTAMPDPTDARADGQFQPAPSSRVGRFRDAAELTAWAAKGGALSAAEAQALAAEVTRLRAALRKYGHHLPTCALRRLDEISCSCGLEAAAA